MTTRRNKKTISITISYDLSKLIEDYRASLRQEGVGTDFNYSAEFETQMAITVSCRLLALEYPFACTAGDPVDYDCPEYEAVVASRSTARLYEYLRGVFSHAHECNLYNMVRMCVVAGANHEILGQLRNRVLSSQRPEFDQMVDSIVKNEGLGV